MILSRMLIILIGDDFVNCSAIYFVDSREGKMEEKNQFFFSELIVCIGTKKFFFSIF